MINTSQAPKNWRFRLVKNRKIQIRTKISCQELSQICKKFIIVRKATSRLMKLLEKVEKTSSIEMTILKILFMSSVKNRMRVKNQWEPLKLVPTIKALKRRIKCDTRQLLMSLLMIKILEAFLVKRKRLKMKDLLKRA